MANGLKIVSTLVLPTALAFMPLLAGLAQATVAGGSQLLERVYQAHDYFALSELAREQIALNPKSAIAHYYMALAQQQLGQIREASLEYHKVIELDKNGPYGLRASQILRAKPAATLSATTDQSNLTKQRECLINAAEREKAAATARFNGEVNQINRQESLAGQDKEARIQDALKRLMRNQSDVDAKLSRQLSELSGKGDFNQGSRSSAQTVVTSGAGGLVHSYEHLDSDAESIVLPSENPLSATALKMPVNTSKKRGEKTK